MLTPISALTAHKANPTQATMKRVQQFLDYAATQEPAVLTYRASDMILAIHSDASYLNEENARMFPNQPTKGQFITRHPSSIIKAVMSSAPEAELVVVLLGRKVSLVSRGGPSWLLQLRNGDFNQ